MVNRVKTLAVRPIVKKPEIPECFYFESEYDKNSKIDYDQTAGNKGNSSNSDNGNTQKPQIHLEKLDSSSQSNELECDGDINIKDSPSVSVIDDEEEKDSDPMMELNHRSLRLLQAMIIDHIEQIGQAAMLYTLEEENRNTFNKAINECFGANGDLTNELLRMKEKHDQLLMQEMCGEEGDSSELFADSSVDNSTKQ